MGLGCGKKRLSKVTEILKGQVLARLDGIVVLWTMIERWVQPLKQWATQLYDYSRVEDPSY